MKSGDKLYREIAAIIDDITRLSPEVSLVSTETMNAFRQFVRKVIEVLRDEKDPEEWIYIFSTFGLQMFLAGREHALRGLDAPEPNMQFTLPDNMSVEDFLSFIRKDEDE